MADETMGVTTTAEECPQTIQVEQVIGADKQQRVLEFDMTVPPQKPPIEQVIDVFVRNVCVNKIDVIPNKVIVRGELDVKVMYVADLPDQPVHSFEMSKVKWTRDIPIEGVMPDMKAKADVVVEFVDFDFDDDEPREVRIAIVLRVWAKVYTTVEMDVAEIADVGEVVDVAHGGAPDVKTSAQMDGTSASATGGGDEVVSASGTQDQPCEIGVHQPESGQSNKVSGTAEVTGSVVNVRSGPGVNFPIVAKVNKGTMVTLKDQAFGWFRVILPSGQEGWIAGWLLQVMTRDRKSVV